MTFSPSLLNSYLKNILFPGYRRYFNKLRDFLSSQPFAGEIQLIDKEDRRVTGNFEVTILGDEPIVIHSKRHAGQGRAETSKEQIAIAQQIQEYLDDM